MKTSYVKAPKILRRGNQEFRLISGPWHLNEPKEEFALDQQQADFEMAKIPCARLTIGRQVFLYRSSVGWLGDKVAKRGGGKAIRFALRSPSGQIFHGNNISDFVKTHRLLFDPDDVRRFANSSGCRASQALITLRPDCKRRQNQWKGWRWASETDTKAEVIVLQFPKVSAAMSLVSEAG